MKPMEAISHALGGSLSYVNTHLRRQSEGALTQTLTVGSASENPRNLTCLDFNFVVSGSPSTAEISCEDVSHQIGGADACIEEVRSPRQKPFCRKRAGNYLDAVSFTSKDIRTF